MSPKHCPFLNKTCIAGECAIWRTAGECALLAAGNYLGSVNTNTVEIFKQLGGEVEKTDTGLKLTAHPEKVVNG